MRKARGDCLAVTSRVRSFYFIILILLLEHLHNDDEEVGLISVTWCEYCIV
jgi:hypothetical protein